MSSLWYIQGPPHNMLVDLKRYLLVLLNYNYLKGNVNHLKLLFSHSTRFQDIKIFEKRKHGLLTLMCLFSSNFLLSFHENSMYCRQQKHFWESMLCLTKPKSKVSIYSVLGDSYSPPSPPFPAACLTFWEEMQTCTC